eukprot:scaffold1272_cov250-Pinguiococcus_pyrenoidosus.AAC.5
MESKTEPFGPEDDDDDTSAGDLLKLKTALYFANLKQFDLVTKIIKAVCDVLVSMNLPGMDLPKHVTGYRINEGVMGIAGAVSGLIIVYNNWPRRTLAVWPGACTARETRRSEWCAGPRCEGAEGLRDETGRDPPEPFPTAAAR